MGTQTATPIQHGEQVNLQDKKTYIAKMSISKLGCNPKAILAQDANDPTPLNLCQIFGSANDTKTTEDKRNNNIYTALVGEFEGVNLQNGTTFRAGQLFLPDGIQQVIESKVDMITKMREQGMAPDSLSVQFALQIRCVRASNPAGYSYQAINLVPMKQMDALSALREFVRTGEQPLVDAPKPVAKLPAANEPPAAPEAPTPLDRSNEQEHTKQKRRA